MKPSEVFERPYLCLLVGLAAFPIAKVLYIPNYVFNFLTTLVHEIGHSLGAWLMGMPSLPAVSPAGGGFARWEDQVLPLVLIIIAVQGYFIYRFRHQKKVSYALAVLLVVYMLLAFTSGRELVAIAGGMAIEVVGAAVCFAVCLGVPLERPFERPIYALWGWWMLGNRMVESFLMLIDRSYRDSTTIITSGLAAGLPSDMTQLAERGIPPTVTLIGVMLIGLSSLPAAMLYARTAHRRRRQAMAASEEESSQTC